MASRTFACAHRGDNYCAPENTLPAFALAVQKGAHQIEFDLRVTRDEQLIVIHDETVDRTTDGTGRASRSEWRTSPVSWSRSALALRTSTAARRSETTESGS